MGGAKGEYYEEGDDRERRDRRGGRGEALQPTQIGKAKVAYPAIKRLLIHIFALRTFRISSDTIKYCN